MGMAASDSRIGLRFSKAGLMLTSPSEGIALLESVLQASKSEAPVAASISWHKLLATQSKSFDIFKDLVTVKEPKLSKATNGKPKSSVEVDHRSLISKTVEAMLGVHVAPDQVLNSLTCLLHCTHRSLLYLHTSSILTGLLMQLPSKLTANKRSWVGKEVRSGSNQLHTVAILMRQQ